MQSVRRNGLCIKEDKLFPSKFKYKNYLEMNGTFISRSSRCPYPFKLYIYIYIYIYYIKLFLMANCFGLILWSVLIYLNKLIRVFSYAAIF